MSIRFTLAFFFYFLPLVCFSQKYIIDVWLAEDGLPQNTVNCITRTKDGYLWLSTSGGLVRFDGSKFRVYDMSNTPELKSNRIQKTFVDSKDRLWIGTHNNGLVRYKDGIFTNISNKYELENSTISEIIEDKKGNVYVGTSGKGMRLIKPDGSYLKYFETGKVYERIIRKFYLDGNRVWVINNRSLECLNDKGIDTTDRLLKDFKKLEDIGNMRKLDDKYLFISKHMLIEYKNGTFTHIPVKDGNKDCELINMTHFDNEYYVTGLDGLVKIDPKTYKYEIINKKQGLSDNYVKWVFKDDESNMWIGMDIGGLVRLKHNPFRYLDNFAGLPSRNYLGVVLSSDSTYWFGTKKNGIYRIKDNKYTNIVMEEGGLSSNVINGMYEDRSKRIWIGPNSTCVQYIYKDRFYNLFFDDSLVRQTTGFIEDKNGTIWIGTGNGLFVYKNNKLSSFTKGVDADANVSYFCFSSKNELLVSTENKLYFIDIEKAVGREVRFPGKESLYLRGILELKDGSFLIGSYGNGIYHLDSSGCINNINEQNGLTDNVASYITSDHKGNIWITGNKGLSRTSEADIFSFLNKKISFLNCILYNKDEGLDNVEFNGGFPGSGFHIRKNEYIFPSLNGAILVDFDRIRINTTPPMINIDKVLLNDSISLQPENLEVPYGDNRLEIQFMAMSYTSTKNIRYRYILEGYNNSWSNPVRDGKVSYTSLPPGEYTFRIKASNNDGIWNETGTSLKIKITPPYYMTVWFRLLAFLFVATLILLSIVVTGRMVSKKEKDRSAFMSVFPDLMLRMNKNRRYIEAFGNQRDLIKPFEKIKGKLPEDVLTPDIAELVSVNHEKALETGLTQIFEYELIRMDGQKRLYEGRMVALQKKEVIYVIRDITQAREAERAIIENQKKLSKLLDQQNILIEKINEKEYERINAIISAQENERKRIANELHDGAGHLLSLIKINISEINERFKPENGDSRFVNNALSLIDNVTSELRNISFNLMPSSLSRFGIVPTLEDLSEKMGNGTGLEISFVKNTSRDTFGEKIDLNIYRIVQEVLNNVINHAHSTEVSLQIIEHEDSLVVLVEDNGIGFNIDKIKNKSQSRGLINIYSRVDVLKGSVSIDSVIGYGTTTIIEIPYSK